MHRVITPHVASLAVTSVTFDTVQTGSSVTSASSLSYSSTVSAGATAICWLTFQNTGGNSTITSVNYGSSGMTQIGSTFSIGTSGSFHIYLAAFQLASAPGTAQTVTITPAASSYMKSNIVSYKNVTSVGTPATNSATGTSLSLSGVSSATTHMVTQCFTASSVNAITSYSQTSRWSSNSGSWQETTLIGDAAGASTVSFTGSLSASALWGAMAIDLI